MSIRVGARPSPLSRAQLEEVFQEIGHIHSHLSFEPVWIATQGDMNRTISLRTLGQSDFFTREIDQALLEGKIDLAIHSAKDLPHPLPEGLSLIALTRGLDPRDSLVFREGENLETLKPFALVATSSERRERAILRLRSDLRCVDIRGNIGERLLQLNKREIDALVVAEAALLRLKLTHLPRLILAEETAPFQGRLALITRRDDDVLRRLFAPLHHE